MKEKTRLILNIEEVEVDGKKCLRVTATDREELILTLCCLFSDGEAGAQHLYVAARALAIVMGANSSTRDKIDNACKVLREHALEVYDDAAKWRDNKAKADNNHKKTQCS